MAVVGFHSWGVKLYGCPLDNCISIFWLSSGIFGCPECTDNQNFERWLQLFSSVLTLSMLHSFCQNFAITFWINLPLCFVFSFLYLGLHPAFELLLRCVHSLLQCSCSADVSITYLPQVNATHCSEVKINLTLLQYRIAVDYERTLRVIRTLDGALDREN